MKLRPLPFFTIAILLTVSFHAHAQSLPTFDAEHWTTQRDAARGKIVRGTGLTFLGAASVVPAVILINKAVDNPRKYLGWALVIGVATLGMTGHGIGSVGFGIKQKRQAQRFIDDYSEGTTDTEAQKKAWLYNNRKSAIKLSLFGSVLALQGAILLANGIYDGVQKAKGENLDDNKVWPSYLVGGLLLPAGIFVLVHSIMKYKAFQSLETAPVHVDRRVAVVPYFYPDPRTGAPTGGITGQWSF